MIRQFSTYSKLLCILSICLLGILVYSNSLNSSFHFDDHTFITQNKNIKNIKDVGAIWNALANPTRFVTFYSFALNYHFHKLDVLGYHVVNLLIHILNGLLVWWLVQLLLETPKLKEQNLIGNKEVFALWVALLFVAHPIQTQAVTYVAQRFASLATLFYLAAVCFYLKSRLGTTHKRFLICLFIVASILAMFTKEISFTLPIVILFLEFVFIRSKDGTQVNKFLVVILIALLALVPLLFGFDLSDTLFVTITESQSHPGDVIHSGNYLLTQPRVIGTYLKLLVLPIGQTLDYDFEISKNLTDGPTLLCISLLIVLIGAGIAVRKRLPLVFLGMVWFFVTIAVESSIIPIRNVIFEHRVYLPFLGFALAFVSLLYLFLSKKVLLHVSLSLIVLMCSYLTCQRNMVWKDDITLWKDVIEKAPHKLRGYKNLGVAYSQAGEYEKSILAYNQALSIDPNHAVIYNNRANAYTQVGKAQSAFLDYNRAVLLDPKDPMLFNSRASFYHKVGFHKKALNDYTKAVELDSRYALAYKNRGNLYSEQGQYAKAIADYTEAIAQNPYLTDVYRNRGYAYYLSKDYGKALEDFTKDINENPQAQGYVYRGVVHSEMGNLNQSMNDFDAALDLDQEFEQGFHNKGILMTKLNNYQAAIKEFSEAIRLKPEGPLNYYYRSISYKNVGQRGKALEDAQKAISLGYKITDQYLQTLK